MPAVPGPVKVPKLVRDNMVEIWAKYEDKVEYRILSEYEMKAATLEKLVEEANEAKENPSAEEFADVWEVFMAAVGVHGYSQQDIAETVRKKRLDRGGFHKGIYLTKFEWGPKR